jgi:hypothetical protein
MKFDKHLIVILKKMCKSVGADYNNIDFKKEQWFWKHEWYEKQETEFTQWLGAYLYKDKDARAEIMEYPRKDKKFCDKAAQFFVFNYGWRRKD